MTTTDTRLHRRPIPGGHLAYRDTGSGQPVVLLHGGALDHRMWDRQIDSLSPTHRVVAVDARGHGDSSTPAAPFRHCDDLAALLRQADLAPAVLVGVSMGASTALDTALEHPDLVRAVVISGAGTSEPDFRDPWIHDIQATWERTASEGDAEGWIDASMKFVWGPHRRASDVDPDVLARCRAMMEKTIATHVVPSGPTGPVLPTPVSSTWQRLPGIRVPVLAIIGGADSDDHIRMPEDVVAAVPDGRSAVVGGTGHYPNMERPELFDAILREFLSAR